jgi:hypothetical protein
MKHYRSVALTWRKRIAVNAGNSQGYICFLRIMGGFVLIVHRAEFFAILPMRNAVTLNGVFDIVSGVFL